MSLSAPLFEYKSWEEASNKIRYSSMDRKVIQSKIEENKRLALIEEQKRFEEAAKNAQEIWQCSSSTGNHAYLKEKHVHAYDIRFSNKQALLIPLKDMEGKLHSLQFIYQENGTFLKRFLQGGKKQGHFHLIGTINADSLICITEDYATGASWHEATAHPAVIAFDSGNLFAVTQAVRARYPSNQVLIVGDDDLEAKINVGREKAKEAAKAHNCLTIFPEFKLHRFDSTGKAFTDFNDLHVSHGLLEIQTQLEALKVLFLENVQLLSVSAKILLIFILFVPAGLELITCLIVAIFRMLFFEESSSFPLIKNLME